MTIFENIRKSVEEEFDPEAFKSLAEEFGGLAGWYIKKYCGGWSEDAWDDTMLNLYNNRSVLDGVSDQDERGLAALQAFAGKDPTAAMLRRIERKRAERSSFN